MRNEYDDLIVPMMRRRRRLGMLGGKGDTTAPVLTSPFALPFGDTSGHIGVVTDEGNGTLYYVLTTSSSTPSAAQVKAGQNDGGTAAAASGNQAIASTGTKTATPTGLTSNTLYYPYWMHEDAIGNQSLVKGLTSFTTLTTGTSDTDYDNLIAAMSVAPTDFRKGLIARFIGALYAASVWTKIDAMWVMAAHDEQAARLNWKSPGSFTLTAVNSPTFVADTGFNGNGSTSYLDTGWDRATNGVQYTQDNAHASCYQRTFGNNNVPPFADNQAGPRVAIGGRPASSGGGSTLINTSTLVNGPASGTLPIQGLGRRNNATQVSLLRDGVQVTAPTTANSGALGTADLVFGKYGNTYVSAQVCGGSVGAYFDDTEALAFYNAWNAYMVAIGADT